MARVIVYKLNASTRSGVIGDAMAAGARKFGDEVEINLESFYKHPTHDVAVFYGFKNSLPQVMRDYCRAGRAVVFVDLGYWGRRANGVSLRFRGAHKVSVNSRHPTAYFRKFAHDGARREALGLAIAPWRSEGKHILLAGMGVKASMAMNYIPDAWERNAVAQIKKVTDRQIIYRPKPSCPYVHAINGTTISPKEQGLADVLADCHAVVTHHSNVAVDALLAGVPTFAAQGVAAPMSRQDLSQIENPAFPDDRDAWLNDVTYCQWSVDEMESGVVWRHLKGEGLIP